MTTHAQDEALADQIIARLNDLIRDPHVREDLGDLIETRVHCSEATCDHPTIQVHAEPDGKSGTFGFLGVLNGLVGAIPEGRVKGGWGYITAVFSDDDGKLEGFQKTK